MDSRKRRRELRVGLMVSTSIGYSECGMEYVIWNMLSTSSSEEVRGLWRGGNHVGRDVVWGF